MPLPSGPGTRGSSEETQGKASTEASQCLSQSAPPFLSFTALSHIEPEEDDVPVLDHVLLALGADHALLPGGGHGAHGHQVVVGDDLRPDETTLEVGVDLAGGLGGLGALDDGPGPALVLAAGEEGDQPQQGVAGPDEPVQAALVDPQVLQKHGLLLALQLGDLRLQLGAHGDHLGALAGRPGLHLLVVTHIFAVGEAVLVQVGGVDHGLEGQQVAGGDQAAVVLVAVVAPGGLAVVEPGEQALEHLHLVEELLVPLGGLLGLVDPPLHHLRVGQDQLQVDDVDVPDGVRGALHMDDVLVVEAADHVDDGVGHADVGEELVAQALPPGRALHQPGDVHELDDGGGGLLRVVHLGELVQPLVRHRHHPHVGVDGAEGVVGALRAGVGDGVEQGGLAHVGQSHNT